MARVSPLNDQRKEKIGSSLPFAIRTHLSLLVSLLILSFFFYINLVRHPMYGGVTPTPTSRHGWPFTYLDREMIETDTNVAHVIPYPWPWPAIDTESRTFRVSSLLGDVLVAFLALCATYTLVNRLIWVCWQKRLQEKMIKGCDDGGNIALPHWWEFDQATGFLNIFKPLIAAANKLD